MIFPVKRLRPDAVLPTRASEGSVGYDLYAVEDVTIPSLQFGKVKTGIAVAVPDGYYARIAPRSGLAVRHGLDVLAGVVDPDYRGELVVVVSNFSRGAGDVTIRAGDRVAQLILEACATPPIVELAELPGTQRGAAGFGSSGR